MTTGYIATGRRSNRRKHLGAPELPKGVVITRTRNGAPDHPVGMSRRFLDEA